MIEQILVKAGAVSYFRLLRILEDGCALAKQPIYEWNHPDL
jgi:hypothetical protein